jgi:hypothetical protein
MVPDATERKERSDPLPMNNSIARALRIASGNITAFRQAFKFIPLSFGLHSALIRTPPQPNLIFL